jgi:predicted acyltransferase
MERAPRLLSLDVFRGATIASMILVNNAGGPVSYAPLEHADWHGWTFTDLIFPFFLWITGVAMTLSFARRVERGDDRAKLALHALKRAGLIFLIGLLLNGFPYYRLATIRIPGVLQRIAICYGISALLYLYLSRRGRIAATIGLLLAYLGLMGLGGGWEVHNNYAHYVDSVFLSGHMYSRTKTWDPEGIVSTLPAIATCLLGIFTGEMLRVKRSREETTAQMFSTGFLLTIAGCVLSLWIPINKSLWTSSYAVLMAGFALLAFAWCYWTIDVRGYQGGTKPFQIFGVNALAVYVLSGVIGRGVYLIKVGDVSLHTYVYRSFFEPLASPANASLLYALANVAICYAAAWLMYRRGWILRV